MKGKDLHIFLIILIISTVLGWFIIDCTFNLYSDLQQSKQFIEQNVQTNLVLDQLCIKLMNV